MSKTMNSNFCKKIKHGIQEREEALMLQSKFENGEIVEGDITEKQMLVLENLYAEQIRDLKDKLAKEEKDLKLKDELINKYSNMLKNCQ